MVTVAPLLKAAVVAQGQRTPYKHLLDVVVVAVEPTPARLRGVEYLAVALEAGVQLGVAPVLLMVVMPLATHAVVAVAEAGGNSVPEDMEQGATVVLAGLVSSI